ncbi:glutamate--cysteine ligase, chloroplastic-like [Aristolochia californica]|uniref:glutamate--cysteine ligase, chloroplastic-like n=1 Tax=Aristolochia californica TaxID=171875 RepID=UPI0035DB919E
MALISQNAPSYCMYSEMPQFKYGQNATLTMSSTMECNALLRNMPSSRESTIVLSSSRCKRVQRMVVAASPPTEDAVVATDPLTKEDLVAYLASGCKPKEKWRIGTEHEKFGFELETLRPVRYEQIAELLNGLAERFDWDRIMEGEHIIGLKQGKQSISLEPGGQFELSGAPLETVHQTCAEVNSHLYQVKAVAEDIGIGFLGIGFQPKWELKDISIMPKGRYDIMRRYMPKVGSLGLDMMFRTCTVQVNLDFSSEADMIRKFRAGLALQPIATALFANSPFKEGKPNGYLSMRSHIWTDTDNNRAGMLPFVFDDSFGFEQYVDYALDVPMYFVYRNKKYMDCSGMSFRDFMDGKLPKIPGELPTLNDWENHLTTIFPEVRLKRYLEMRGADGGPWRRICALPAFWVGLLYDEVSLQNVIDLTSDWTTKERQMLRNKVTLTGLKTPFRDGLLRHVAEEVLRFAQEGLERRGYKETGFLKEVAEVVRTGETPAERLLDLYHEKWGGSVDPVFEELLY